MAKHFATDTTSYNLVKSDSPRGQNSVCGNELHSDDLEHLRRWAMKILETDLAQQIQWLQEVTNALELTRKRMEKVKGW